MGRRTGRAHSQIALAVFLGIAARLRAALFVPAPIMSLNMLGQMIGPHEPFITHRTCESFLTRVRAQVPLQLIGPRESLAAEQPVADEGPLARVPPQMRLQMRGLAVDLPAAGYVAAVDVLLAEVHAGGAEALSFLAVGTVARGAAGVPALGPG